MIAIGYAMGVATPREHYDTDVTDGWRRGGELQAVEEAWLFYSPTPQQFFCVHITDIYGLGVGYKRPARKSLHPDYWDDYAFFRWDKFFVLVNNHFDSELCNSWCRHGGRQGYPDSFSRAPPDR